MSRYESLSELEQDVVVDRVVIRCFVGSETGPSSSSKGFVFVLDDNIDPLAEVSLGTYRDKTRLGYVEQKINSHEGSGIVQGSWTIHTFLVQSGTILKLFSMGTFSGRGGKRMGGVYLQADPSASEIRAIGYAVQSRNRAWIQGRLAPIPTNRFKALGISCPKHYLHSYVPGVGAELVIVAPAKSPVTGQVRVGRRFSL